MKKTKDKYVWWLIMFGVMFMSAFMLEGILTGNANIGNISKEEGAKLTTCTYRECPKLIENYFNDRLPYREILISVC